MRNPTSWPVADRRTASLPLSLKIAAGALAAGIFSIAAATYITASTVQSDLRREFQSSRAEITRQIASNIAHALRVRKAEVVEEAYASLLNAPGRPIVALATVTADGETVTQFARSGSDTARLISLPDQPGGKAAFDGKTVWLGDELISIAPAGLGGDGNPLGYLVIAWNTQTIANTVWNTSSDLLKTLSLVMLVMIAATLFLVSRLAVAPLKRLSDRMIALANGDIISPMRIEGWGYEIGTMAHAVTIFRDREIERLSLEAEMRASDQAAAQRREQIEVLIRRFSEEVRMALRSVLTTLSDMQSKASDMMRASGHAASMVSPVVANSHIAETQLELVTEAAQQLAKSIKDISRDVSKATTVISKADMEFHTAADKIGQLSAAAEKIGAIVKLIRDISEQTNLLALNATIEAARAGEAGKGFAVVACEVKTLATRTAKATRDVATQIGAVQLSTGETAETIKGITRIISEINALSISISAAIRQQTAATAEIGQNIDQAAHETSRLVSGVAKAKDTIDAANAVIADVERSASCIQETSDLLNGTIERFLIDVAAA